MSKRIKIDEEKCIGCGLCVNACQQGAIGLVDGKAMMLREDYCDKLGNCLPVCPTDAISFEEKMDTSSIQPQQKGKQIKSQGCPGEAAREISQVAAGGDAEVKSGAVATSQLMQWPVQIKLVPTNAPYFDQANLLVAADCTAFSYGNFHKEFIKDHITLIGCPKLDEGDYAEKLAEILKKNDINKITVARMEVPCCGGIVEAVKNALQNSGKIIPWQIITISTDGKIIDN